MTVPTTIDPENEALIETLISSHAAQNYELSYETAQQIIARYDVDDIGSYTEIEGLSLILAHTISKIVDAGLYALQRQFADSAQTFHVALDLLSNVNWRDNLDAHPIFPEYRKLHMQAAMQAPLMEANEALVRGSFSEASLKILTAESQLPELRAILSPDAPEDEAYMREVAFTMVNAYFMVGAITHMQNATHGDRLLQARNFFERFDMMVDQFTTVDIETVADNALIKVMHAFANAARLRVEGELKASEEDYEGANKLLTEAILAFERIAPLITADIPTGDVMREVTVNMGPIIMQSIRHYANMGLMQEKLEVAKDRQAGLKEQLRALDERKDEIVLNALRKEMNFTFQSMTEFAAEINIQNNITINVQNNGMDQVLALLSQLPKTAETEAVKKDAQKAKEEKDLAEKIKKVAAVIDGASKVIEAGAKFVPYGPPVLKALKGVFGMLGALRDDGGDDSDGLPETHMV